MSQKEIYDIEFCIKKHLQEIVYKIPFFMVKEFDDYFLIEINFSDEDAKTLSPNIIKKWIKNDNIIEFEKMKCGKEKPGFYGSESVFWCEIYKKIDNEINANLIRKRLRN